MFSQWKDLRNENRDCMCALFRKTSLSYVIIS